MMMTRRTLLRAGATAAAVLPFTRMAFADSCRLLPQQELGPYYLADELLRSDITEGRPGMPLALKLLVLDGGSCRPLQGAAVDIWHCDAGGVYSGFGNESTAAETFLRGIQLTDGDGTATFKTIFPGCYPGRTNHIHFKVRLAGAVEGKTYRGGHVAHTGQVFFPEETAADLMQTGIYAQHAIRRTTAAEDGIFGRQDGAASTAKLTPVLAADPAQGFAAVLVAAVDPGAG